MNIDHCSEWCVKINVAASVLICPFPGDGSGWSFWLQLNGVIRDLTFQRSSVPTFYPIVLWLGLRIENSKIILFTIYTSCCNFLVYFLNSHWDRSQKEVIADTFGTQLPQCTQFHVLKICVAFCLIVFVFLKEYVWLMWVETASSEYSTLPKQPHLVMPRELAHN